MAGFVGLQKVRNKDDEGSPGKLLSNRKGEAHGDETWRGSSKSGFPTGNAKASVKEVKNLAPVGGKRRDVSEAKRARQGSSQEATPSTAMPSDAGPSTQTASPDGVPLSFLTHHK